MKLFLLFIALSMAVVCNNAHGEFNEEFSRLKKEGDPKAIQQFLAKSYDLEKGNPDYFVTAANYWGEVANEVSMTTKPAEAGGISITDSKTGKEVGSISSMGKNNPEIPLRALSLLKEGYDRFPCRLDIGFGTAYMQEDLKKPSECFDTLIKVLKICKQDSGKLLWKNNQALPGPAEKFVPEAIQRYTSNFYEARTHEDDKRCRELCEQVTAVFPNHPYAYNILAALSHVNGDEKTCLSYLQTAHKKDPADMIVLLNLGDAYLRTGGYTNALKCYQEVKSSDAESDMKTQADSAIREVKRRQK